jgi:hypothetical protein
MPSLLCYFNYTAQGKSFAFGRCSTPNMPLEASEMPLREAILFVVDTVPEATLRRLRTAKNGQKRIALPESLSEVAS